MLDLIHRHTDVSGNESNHQLFRLWALRPRLWYDVLVQRLQSALKACKLHHGVWDLTTPQRHNTFVEPDSNISLHYVQTEQWLSPYLSFNGHFLGEPRLAGFIVAKDDGSGGDNWSYKTQSSNQITTLNKPTPSFVHAGCPFTHPTISVKALKGKKSNLHST